MISHARLLELLSYNPENGVFTWRPGHGGRFSGHEAGCGKCKSRRGKYYRYLRLEGENYSASRTAHFYMTGKWPIFEIDHRNGDTLDNSWANLRQATRQQNELNKGPYRTNKCGFKGVRLLRGRYLAAIHRNYCRKNLGSFDTAEEAAAVYAAAVRAFDGDFARVA